MRSALLSWIDFAIMSKPLIENEIYERKKEKNIEKWKILRVLLLRLYGMIAVEQTAEVNITSVGVVPSRSDQLYPTIQKGTPESQWHVQEHC